MTTPALPLGQTSTGTVATDRGERYVKQLGDHFGRKVPVTDTPQGRRVEFPAGTCLMSVTTDQIVLAVTSADADGVATVQDVVTRHLERFAARDGLRVVWDA